MSYEKDSELQDEIKRMLFTIKTTYVRSEFECQKRRKIEKFLRKELDY